MTRPFLPSETESLSCAASSGHCACSGERPPERREIFLIAVGALIFVTGMTSGPLGFSGSLFERALFLASYAILGGTVLREAVRNLLQGKMFDENFLMSIATVGALAIGEFAEAAAVMLLYRIGEAFQDAAVRRSKRSIAALMDIRPDSATVERAGALLQVAPEAVVPGEILLVKTGERIPLDGVVIEGSAQLDTRALTGESLPRTVEAGDAALSGMTHQGGAPLRICVTKTAWESTVHKILELVEHAAARKAKTENFITVFARYYTPIVVGLAVLLAILPPIFDGGEWSEWVHRSLIFLVISCPCALVISIPLTFFGGIGAASRRGILLKGGNCLEALCRLDTVVFDKTGTLTRGDFEVVEVHAAAGISEAEILELASCAEHFSNHPLAASILRAHGKPIDPENIRDYREIPGQGVAAQVRDARILLGNTRLMSTVGIAPVERDVIGTQLHLTRNETFIGTIVIADRIREDSPRAIAELRERGVREIIMLTGDQTRAARHVAQTLGLDGMRAECLPTQKVEHMETLIARRRSDRKIAFVGDGINDAPALALADLGVAMGGLGSDAAIEAADVVLMTDEPSRLTDAIDIARATKRIAWQNIAIALGVKGLFLLFAVFGIATMWEAVFADTGVCVLAILNALRILAFQPKNENADVLKNAPA